MPLAQSLLHQSWAVPQPFMSPFLIAQDHSACDLVLSQHSMTYTIDFVHSVPSLLLLPCPFEKLLSDHQASLMLKHLVHLGHH